MARYLPARGMGGVCPRPSDANADKIGAVDQGLLMLLVGAVLGASVLAAHGAARTGLPVLVAFLGLGMLLGSDGPGGIAFDDADLTRRGGVGGLSPVLYSGGVAS